MPLNSKIEGTAKDRDINVISDAQEWYCALDGDDMGHEVEDALVKNDVARSQEFEKQIKGAFAEIEEWIISIGGAVVFCGGDNLLWTANGNPKEMAEKAREIYKNHTDHTSSVGVGHLPVEAHKALVITKNTGKNKYLIWDDDQEEVYRDIQEQQDALEKCEEEVREDSDLDLQTSPGLKYKADLAKRHYERLIGAGYGRPQALLTVINLYKLGESYRDVIRKKNPLQGSTPAEVYLREGEEMYSQFVANGFARHAVREIPALAVGQKIVTGDDLGRVAFVGRRFISVEWLRSGKREKIVRSRLDESIQSEKTTVLPQIRMGKSNA